MYLLQVGSISTKVGTLIVPNLLRILSECDLLNYMDEDS